MRLHTLQVTGGKTEEDILKWANELVNDSSCSISGFDDKSLKNSLFLIKLEAAIEKRVVDWENVQKDETNEAYENNAKYCISIARKLGATIFLTWEDITEIKSKMLFTFLSGLYDAHQMQLSKKSDKK